MILPIAYDLPNPGTGYPKIEASTKNLRFDERKAP